MCDDECWCVRGEKVVIGHTAHSHCWCVSAGQRCVYWALVDDQLCLCLWGGSQTSFDWQVIWWSDAFINLSSVSLNETRPLLVVLVLSLIGCGAPVTQHRLCSLCSLLKDVCWCSGEYCVLALWKQKMFSAVSVMWCCVIEFVLVYRAHTHTYTHLIFSRSLDCQAI